SEPGDDNTRAAGRGPTTGRAGRGTATPRDATCVPGRRRHRARGAQASVMLPPAASIFSLAVAENLVAVTFSATETSPVPSTLTGWPLRTAPLATRSSTVTSPPEGYSADSLSRLTTW